LALAKAGLAQAESALDQSKRELARIQPLTAIDAVSQQELDAAVAKNEANLASVSAAQAAVKTATLNLGYTNITSPIDGVMGSAQLRLGGLATADTTLLTTVYQLDRLFVNFSVSEQDLLAFQRRIGRAPDENRPTTTARIFLADGSEYPERPTLNFVGAAVDPNTGTLAVRLIVPNPNGLLHAGQFARVRLIAQRIPDALLVPQRAVQELQGKNYLWIVDHSGKAEQRDVQMGPRMGENWLVQSGLRPGEVVVVDGVQHLKPGVPVQVLSPGSAPPPASAPAGTTKSRGGS
jgi:membrane fusion protein (multidrug efflux system)